MRLLLIFILSLSFCPVAKAEPRKKIDVLMSYFDMNEAAFAYHRHCLSRSGNINETFLRTLEFVADELFAEAVKNMPGTDPEYIKTKILERRYNLQYRLDQANIKEGCNSHPSIIAKQHYQELSNVKKSDVRKFIDEQTEGTKE